MVKRIALRQPINFGKKVQRKLTRLFLRGGGGREVVHSNRNSSKMHPCLEILTELTPPVPIEDPLLPIHSYQLSKYMQIMTF